MASKNVATYDEARGLIRKAMAEHKLVLLLDPVRLLMLGCPSGQVWSLRLHKSCKFRLVMPTCLKLCIITTICMESMNIRY